MKHIFSILFCAVLFCSCNNDEEEKAYIIKYVVRANTDSAIQMIYPRPKSELFFWVKNYYECGDTIKESDAADRAILECRCKDPNTLLTGEIYIDGELKAKEEANTELNVYYKFK
jgi:hypothetical protein